MPEKKVAKHKSTARIRGKTVRVMIEVTVGVTRKDGLLASSQASASCPIGRSSSNSCKGAVIKSETYTKPTDARQSLIKKMTEHFKAAHLESEF